MKRTTLFLLAMALSLPLFAGGKDDPLVYKVMIDQLETRITDGSNPLVLEADAWVGYDLHKFWFKTDVERVDGETEEAEIQLLYSRAISPFWDIQAGWRRDIKPKPDRDYLTLAFKGLAPYLFEVDAGLFIGESGRINARLDAEYEYMLTQKWVLSPELSMNLYSKDDEERGIGSGLSDMSLGLRLRYEIRREFAPYIGVNWRKQFGDTADFTEAEDEDTSDTQFVVGIRAWF
ncbi:MAG: copper resistance protein B [Candidatus Thiodiazotropha lotti]|uniref:Copper resistance protein CopB n=1 Tax=Candidatus Thiodiazotropha endoloripes TaxID=1818881 RepID=A0A1E2UTG9_9GAMM|nr:copper resistance protein B [Candidatus Thiodiazotropha endoloripes]MCG7898512.1 copper resistance protein B [Candidatus Thiodiazotropha weberae]MCG8001737.1 copper resistance protein B [Candidatus Thiodiazotropha lotti]MCG7904354.1 copper resistance protein B [Candidatus Thiodiazotropha weberae]MCG7915702.1 copper resistance protein B [Candidatus Thiodiazotropha weberae]MCW4193511.1 copper resistance protein B [Candidatus Thiodiazotropha weberae]